jgi:hypothetical protein
MAVELTISAPETAETDAFEATDLLGSAFDCKEAGAIEADAAETPDSAADGSGADDLREADATTVGFAASVLRVSASNDCEGTMAMEFDGLIVKKTAELLGAGIFAASMLFDASAEDALTDTDGCAG